MNIFFFNERKPIVWLSKLHLLMRFFSENDAKDLPPVINLNAAQSRV